MNCSTPGLPVHHHLPEFTQTHVHRVCDAIQSSHPLSSPSPPAPNPSQHQSLFQWVNSSHEVAKVLEFSFSIIPSKLDSILKSRDITLPTKVCLINTVVFLVDMYGCESWTIKKAERWRIDAFELWCWRRLLRVPWTARRSKQSILKEINPGISLEGTMLKLKLQYLGHLMRRVDSLEKTDAGRDWGQEEKGTTEDEMAGWHHGLDGRESEWTPGVGDGQGGLACCDSWGREESDTTEELNWTKLKTYKRIKYFHLIYEIF